MASSRLGANPLQVATHSI